MNNRLRLIREKIGGSQKKFAESMGISQQTYANYESGKASIPDTIKQQLFVKGINLNWLVTGIGDMFLHDSEEKANELSGITNTTFLTPSGKIYPIPLSDGGLSVPILVSKVSAGPGEEWRLEDIRDDERLPILARFIKPYDKKKIFAAEVRGDSMTGIQIFDGDFVFAVRDLVEGDGIYVISIDGEIFVKRVEYDPFEKKLRIISENERYQDKVVDSDRVILVGKVIGWLHHHPY